MGLVFMVAVGAVLGWLAAIVLDAETFAGLFGNIVAGIIGALLAGLLVSPIVGGGSLLRDHYSVTALIVAFLGSVALITLANVARTLQMR